MHTQQPSAYCQGTHHLLKPRPSPQRPVTDRVMGLLPSSKPQPACTASAATTTGAAATQGREGGLCCQASTLPARSTPPHAAACCWLLTTTTAHHGVSRGKERVVAFSEAGGRWRVCTWAGRRTQAHRRVAARHRVSVSRVARRSSGRESWSSSQAAAVGRGVKGEGCERGERGGGLLAAQARNARTRAGRMHARAGRVTGSVTRVCQRKSWWGVVLSRQSSSGGCWSLSMFSVNGAAGRHTTAPQSLKHR